MVATAAGTEIKGAVFGVSPGMGVAATPAGGAAD